MTVVITKRVLALGILLAVFDPITLRALGPPSHSPLKKRPPLVRQFIGTRRVSQGANPGNRKVKFCS